MGRALWAGLIIGASVGGLCGALWGGSVCGFALLGSLPGFISGFVIRLGLVGAAAALSKVIQRWPDEKLIAAYRRYFIKWEPLGFWLGCSLVVAQPLLLVLAASPIGRRHLILILGLFAGVWFLRRLQCIGTKSLKAESQRRFGPLAEELLDAQELLVGKDAPDWVLILSGATLPYGDSFWVLVQLSEPGSGRIDAKVAPLYAKSNRFPHQVHNESLPDEWCRSLLTTLENIADSGFRDLASNGIRDGFPCTVSVLRRSPLSMWKVSCNLVATGQSQAPVVILARALLTACSSYKPIVSPVGAYIPEQR